MAIGEQDLVRQCMIAPHKASEVQCKDAHHRSPVERQGSMSTNLDTTRPQRPFLYFGPMAGPSRPGIRQRQAQIAPLDMPRNGQGPHPASQPASQPARWGPLFPLWNAGSAHQRPPEPASPNAQYPLGSGQLTHIASCKPDNPCKRERVGAKDETVAMG